MFPLISLTRWRQLGIKQKRNFKLSVKQPKERWLCVNVHVFACMFVCIHLCVCVLCSNQAMSHLLLSPQMDLFREEYVKSFKAHLLGYAQSQISNSMKTHENLTRIREQLLAWHRFNLVSLFAIYPRMHVLAPSIFSVTQIQIDEQCNQLIATNF